MHDRRCGSRGDLPFHADTTGLAGRQRDFRPFGAVIVLCAFGMSGCGLLYDRVVPIEPAPTKFGREYPEEFAAAGRKIAQKECASCHAIDQQPKSPDPKAPPFNTLLLRQNPEKLADNLIAGNRVGHDGMPRFDFNVIAADSLLAYLEALHRDTGAR